MSLWSKLFGGGADAGGGRPSESAEDYKDFLIYPEPVKEAGGYRVAARIEKEIGGETRRHDLIRADVCGTQEEALAMSVLKSKSLIDEQGEAIFD